MNASMVLLYSCMILHVRLRKPRSARQASGASGLCSHQDTGLLHRLTPAHLVLQCTDDVSKSVVPIVKAFGGRGRAYNAKARGDGGV